MPSSLSTLAVLLAFSVYIVSSQPTEGPGYECDEYDNCSGKGLCDIDDEGDWYCICDDGYATHPEPDDDESDEDKEYCNYEQKKQLTAFLLAWFLGYLGGGHWYLGLYGLAAAKLCVVLGLCCLPCCCILLMIGLKLEDYILLPFYCIQCCGGLGMFVWWLVDVILFGMNVIDDGDGVSLEPW